MPFLHNDIIHQQVDYFNQTPCEAFVPRIDSHIEPLHAVYSKTLRKRIASFLEDNEERSIKEFLKIINARYFELDDTVLSQYCFKNLNTPVDFKQAKETL